MILQVGKRLTRFILHHSLSYTTESIPAAQIALFLYSELKAFWEEIPLPKLPILGDRTAEVATDFWIDWMVGPPNSDLSSPMAESHDYTH